MEGTLFSPALEALKLVKYERGDIQTKPFLDVCKFVLPILDKFGASMTVVKADISGNISRLDSRYNSNTTRFNYLYSFVQAEIETSSAKSSSSCTNGLLWLTRAMDFIVELFRNLDEHRDLSMSHACSHSYSKTLKKWHGWLASSSFMVVMKLVPERKKFIEVLGGENSYGDMENFCTAFSPILKDIHKFLTSCGLDHMKAS
ncbi:PREDICTED: glycolipid transfer protein 1-like [Ipomoea nil]|uniref:glycolipid transfer protein 1-like n=1 Tax=Ipomoea nil TaxID=35883 RepID=UPI00090120F8|nr:PREDICTED: glycolipid transfer protein 1-like [Ipomoea nil]